MKPDDSRALRELLAEASTSLAKQGFSEIDNEAFQVSLRELVDNVGVHVGTHGTARIKLEYEGGDRPTYHDSVVVTVSDDGQGFDFEATLQRLDGELVERGTEHGLLRASRLGSLLIQNSRRPHVMAWMKEKSPDVRQVGFANRKAIPFVFSYRDQAIRISQNVYTFFQFRQFFERSPEFMRLVMDPLRRPAWEFVGVEILGHGWTRALSWEAVLDRLMTFLEATGPLTKTVLVYANTGPSEQEDIREYCEARRLEMFEDPQAIRQL